MKRQALSILALLLCLAGTPAHAQLKPINPARAAPVLQAPRTLPPLIDFTINNGTMPQYRTGSNLVIRYSGITAAGPKGRINLYLPLDNIRLNIEPQAQTDGQIVAHIPESFYARAQRVEFEMVLGDETLKNVTGKFVPEIVDVPDDLALRGVQVVCMWHCFPFPPSKNAVMKSYGSSADQFRDHFRASQSVDSFGNLPELGGYWGKKEHPMQWNMESKVLKAQFEIVDAVLSSPVEQSCPTDVNENVWTYRGTDGPVHIAFIESGRVLQGYIMANVTHCRQRGKNNTSAVHDLHTLGRITLSIRGPKGVDPWEQ